MKFAAEVLLFRSAILPLLSDQQLFHQTRSVYSAQRVECMEWHKLPF